MARSATLGYPRIGARRELKRALEAYWGGKTDREELLSGTAMLRRRNWEIQRDAGIDVIPSNDFSLYDHVLDMAFCVGAIPERYAETADRDPLSGYFAMARGERNEDGTGGSTAMEMTKWFDTNYHYIVPEIEAGTRFSLFDDKPVREYREARSLGIETRPVLVGPATFLSLAKSRKDGSLPLDALDRLEDLLAVYGELLKRLSAEGAVRVQMDEPICATDLDPRQIQALKKTYRTIAGEVPGIEITLATYFGEMQENLDLIFDLPVAGVHADLVRGKSESDRLIDHAAKQGKTLSLGLVDGRNVWKTDLTAASRVVARAVETLGADRVEIAPSCSLIHTPVDLEHEHGLDPEIREWLAFARQKLDEITTLTRAANGEDVEEALRENSEALARRKQSPRRSNPVVAQRVAGIDETMARRKSGYAVRHLVQEEALGLPRFPTTTIGSFPQTREIRLQRSAFRKKEISREQYNEFLKGEIRRVIDFQNSIGLDVLVHGEPERNDMVEYFGEHLEGFTATDAGWVQSYGSRCVKPPVIFGDLSRRGPITVEWARFAQSLTARPVKGMLTGPITILQWSFVRDDQPRADTALQIALAIRDEVTDLEAAGIRIIQIDEPALREGLPLRQDRWTEYLEWAARSFRIATTGVSDRTQIHTHMCYAEFNDIIGAIASLDADVISMETSRSDMELLDAFRQYRYPNEIGPGVYDIHSPRIPPVEQMEDLLRKASRVVDAGQLWVNPDCGLKTRSWDEVRPALENMVEAANRLRAG